MARQRWNPTFMRFLPITREAFEYAETMHSGQSRPDGSPFILHPLEVASLLRDAGASDHLIAAGVLHDLIEKTDVTESDLEARFGPAIASLVSSVSDDDGIHGYATRKAALRRQVVGAGDEALTLFAADKLSKVRELRREASAESNGAGAPEPSREPRARRLRHYQRSLALLQERLPRSPLVAELRDELKSLLSDRAVVTEAG